MPGTAAAMARLGGEEGRGRRLPDLARLREALPSVVLIGLVSVQSPEHEPTEARSPALPPGAPEAPHPAGPALVPGQRNLLPGERTPARKPARPSVPGGAGLPAEPRSPFERGGGGPLRGHAGGGPPATIRLHDRMELGVHVDGRLSSGGRAGPLVEQGWGAGVVIEPGGLILTNDHLLHHAYRIEVHTGDGQKLPARVVGRDPESDVALLSVRPRAPLPAARLGDSSRARVGDWVAAVGNPFGLGRVLSLGVVGSPGTELEFAL